MILNVFVIHLPVVYMSYETAISALIVKSAGTMFTINSSGQCNDE